MFKRGISYDFIDRGCNENVVLIHGAGCNKNFLKPLANKIKRCNCYIVDLLGHGKSEKKENIIAEDYIESISEFISDIDNVTLIGHSMGGPICLGVAAKGLSNLKNIVLLNSGASFKKIDKEFMAKVNKGKVDFAYLFRTCGSFFNPLIYKQLINFEKKDVVIKDLLIASTINVEEKLDLITIPLLIITGGDEILTLVEYSELIHSKVKNSELIIVPNTRHMLPVVKKNLIAQKIQDFIIV